jgi:hypothetical protein
MNIASRNLLVMAASLTVAAISSLSFAIPTVYPTGTTIYQPEKTWNGYTVFTTPGEHGSVLIDMNGNEVRRWTTVGAGAGGPARILPGGYVVAGYGERTPYQESIALIQMDWEGNEVWRFDGTEEVKLEDGETVPGSRQHHDWQREGNPVGYYAPDMEPLATSGRTLILSHKNVIVPGISDKRLEDDYIIEVSWDGEILWEWLASDHVEELGFSEDARNAIYRSVNWHEKRESADWLHINAMAYVGPNHWYDNGDARFHPDNIIFSSRQANIIGIIDREGSVVWRMGPDYRSSKALKELGQIIGQHHPHIIPKGLPGAGNLLVFDNGGSAGYGFANPAAPNGRNSVRRDNSRVLEINPVTFEKIWEYSIGSTERIRFFSQYVSSAQRLPNGNTLINEGALGRIFELTSEKEIVWEYVSPYFDDDPTTRNRVYRAYRLPYDWVPQLDKPAERAVIPPALSEFHIAPVER